MQLPCENVLPCTRWKGISLSPQIRCWDLANFVQRILHKQALLKSFLPSFFLLIMYLQGFLTLFYMRFSLLLYMGWGILQKDKVKEGLLLQYLFNVVCNWGWSHWPVVGGQMLLNEKAPHLIQIPERDLGEGSWPLGAQRMCTSTLGNEKRNEALFINLKDGNNISPHQ